jgi:hypothetical protein
MVLFSRSAAHSQPAGQPGANGPGQIWAQLPLLRQVFPVGQTGQSIRFPQLLMAVPPHRPPQKEAAGLGLQECWLRLWA